MSVCRYYGVFIVSLQWKSGKGVSVCPPAGHVTGVSSLGSPSWPLACFFFLLPCLAVHLFRTSSLAIVQPGLPVSYEGGIKIMFHYSHDVICCLFPAPCVSSEKKPARVLSPSFFSLSSRLARCLCVNSEPSSDALQRLCSLNRLMQRVKGGLCMESQVRGSLFPSSHWIVSSVSSAL